MAGDDIIRLEQVGTIILPLKNGLELSLTNIAYALGSDFNLIFLG